MVQSGGFDTLVTTVWHDGGHGLIFTTSGRFKLGQGGQSGRVWSCQQTDRCIIQAASKRSLSHPVHQQHSRHTGCIVSNSPLQVYFSPSFSSPPITLLLYTQTCPLDKWW